MHTSSNSVMGISAKKKHHGKQWVVTCKLQSMVKSVVTVTSEILTLIPMQPFTSSVVRLDEQDFDKASRHASVTPTIPNKLHGCKTEHAFKHDECPIFLRTILPCYLNSSRDRQPCAIATMPASVTRTHLSDSDCRV